MDVQQYENNILAVIDDIELRLKLCQNNTPEFLNGVLLSIPDFINLFDDISNLRRKIKTQFSEINSELMKDADTRKNNVMQMILNGEITLNPDGDEQQ